jgi:hypothetical protein
MIKHFIKSAYNYVMKYGNMKQQNKYTFQRRLETDTKLDFIQVKSSPAGQVACMGEKRNAYKILVGKPERKGTLSRHKSR